MDKQTIKIIGLSLLLTGLAFAVYLLTDSGFNIYLGTALVIAGGIGLYWAYQYIMKLVERKKVNKKEQPKFARLHSLEDPWVKGETTFFVEVEVREKVDLSVLNKKDEVMQKLIDTEKDPGGYPVKFDSTRFPDGIYYYRLITPNQKTVKKMAIRNHS